MREGTKDRILQTGAEIIHRKGFNNTGIQEILDVAGVPKGSFYNYFKNKEDFGLQVIDYFVGQSGLFVKGILGDATVTPLHRVKMVLDRFLDLFKSNAYSCGCPIGNLSQEMGDLSPAFREKLRQAVDSIVDMYSDLLAQAQRAGEISHDLDVRETAYFIVSSWHGALMRMKIEKGPEPLQNHRNFIFDCVLRP